MVATPIKNRQVCLYVKSAALRQRFLDLLQGEMPLRDGEISPEIVRFIQESLSAAQWRVGAPSNKFASFSAARHDPGEVIVVEFSAEEPISKGAPRAFRQTIPAVMRPLPLHWDERGSDSFEDEDSADQARINPAALNQFCYEKELSPRETEILRAMVEGSTNKNIAEFLNISENTVKTHIRRILQKLNVGSRVQAAILVANFSAAETGNAEPAPQFSRRIAS